MGLDIAGLHKLIDDWATAQHKLEVVEAEIVPERKLPEGKRVVRTKASGDKVYLLDDNTETRHWIASPEALEQQGFTMGDVIEVEEAECFKYQMAGPINAN